LTSSIYQGFEVERVIESTPTIVADPGMTTANMKLVTVSVSFDDQLEAPAPKLEEGEHIVKRVVALDELNAELKEYSKKVCSFLPSHDALINMFLN
jgi:ADP-ribose pyrophosphatase